MVEEIWEKYYKQRLPELREQLIIACLPYIKSTAHRLSIYANQSQDTDDLISAGIIGLIDAIDKYDPSKGASFKSYAQHRVRGAIMDEIRSMDWVPYSTREKARKIEKAYAELEQNGNGFPSDEDIAKYLGMTLDQYYSALIEVNRMAISLLDDIFYDDEDVINGPEDEDAKDPENELILTEMENIVGEAIERLPEKERLVITLYYYEELTMKEIGKIFDISESRVCQIHSSAILRLHAKLKHINASSKA
ncbi:MAG: sigma-70 family RNA polymerase sigma factor [bacterium]